MAGKDSYGGESFTIFKQLQGGGAGSRDSDRYLIETGSVAYRL